MRKISSIAILCMLIVSSLVNVLSNTCVASEPVFFEATPADGAVNIDITTPFVSVFIMDPHDEITWTIEGQYLIHAGVNKTNDGRKSANLILPLPYITDIIWYVNATDGEGASHKEIYNFLTRAKYIPSVPSGFTATVMSKSRIDLTWTKGDKANLTYIERNSVSSWSLGAGTKIYNGTGTSYQDIGLLENARYYYQAWSWNQTDKVYSSTYVSDDDTTANQRPVFSVVTPANNSIDIDITTPLASVLIQDLDGDQIDWTIQGQYLTSAGADNDGDGIKTASLILPLPYSTDVIWYVNASDGKGWTRAEYHFITRAIYLPSSPSGFTATVMSKSRIDLAWTKGDKADRTRIERNLYSPWSLGAGIPIYNSTDVNFSDTGLTENVTYYYQAWSWNNTDDVYSAIFVSDNDMAANQPPMFTVVTPSDDTVNAGTNTSQVSVLIQDLDGDTFDWTIEGYYVTRANADDDSDGTKSASLSPPLPFTTDIIWYVNATDGKGWRHSVYNFITRPNLPPVFSIVTPANNSEEIGINTAQVRVYMVDLDGDTFDWTIEGKYVTRANASNANAGWKSANLITPLPKDTEIEWSVHATDSSGSGEWTTTLYDFNTTSTQMPKEKYRKNPGIGLSGVGPIAADVDNDGDIEIIRSSENGISVMYGNNGTVMWTKSVAMWNDHTPMEAIDLNKDGILEIITSHGYGTWALHGNDGSVYWDNPDALLSNKYCVAGDINADGYPEVYVCGIGSVTALTHDGIIFAQNWTYYPCFGGLTLGDTDFDGVFELYQGDRSQYYPEYPSGGRGCQSYWASNLTLRWSHPEILCSSQCPTLVDVDKDGKLDVVICSQSGGGFCVYNSTNGEIIHQTIAIPGVRTHSQATIYDIDDDGNLEIIACRDWSKPVIWDLYLWKVDAWLPYVCYEPPAIADINGDGYVEIIACGKTNISIFNHDYQLMGNISFTNNDNYGMSMIVAQDVDTDGLLELIFNRISTVYVFDTAGPAPNPRALSQFNFYSQHRGRAPYYVEYMSSAPIVKNENPRNGSTDVPYNPQLSVGLYDYQHDLMTITFRTNASTGVWHTLRTIPNIHEGTYTADTTGMSTPQKYYWWRVTVTDSSGNTTTKTYKFKTMGTIVLSNITPTHLAKDIALNPQLSVDIEQRSGLPMTIHFKTNASGSWTTLADYDNAINGTYTQKSTTMTKYNKKYFWSVQCFDGQYWTNATFSFTTISDTSGGGGGGGGGESPAGPQNIKPVANASAGEPYQGFVNSEITFNGSRSYDSDGNITTWSWSFGDGSNGSGKIIKHNYTMIGTYQVTLTVTDDEGAINTDTTTATILKANNPPTQPTISGPINGHQNVQYNFTVTSSDADNDTIHYSIVWGNYSSEINTSVFLPSGTPFVSKHRWPAAGIYTITVWSSDNITESQPAYLDVLIDAIYVGDLGCLIDRTGDGDYETFYSNSTMNETSVQKQANGAYLIDNDGDGDWDHSFDPSSSALSTYTPGKSTPGFEIVFVLCAIALVLIWRRKLEKQK